MTRFEEMKAKFDLFIEFPTEDKSHVTTTSAVLFAVEQYKSGIEEGKRQAVETAETLYLTHAGVTPQDMINAIRVEKK